MSEGNRNQRGNKVVADDLKVESALLVEFLLLLTFLLNLCLHGLQHLHDSADGVDLRGWRVQEHNLLNGGRGSIWGGTVRLQEEHVNGLPNLRTMPTYFHLTSASCISDSRACARAGARNPASINTWVAAEIYYQNSRRSSFSGVYLVFEVFQDTWHSHKEILVHTGTLPCLVPCTLPCLAPWWPQIMQIVSCSDLVLISFWMLAIPCTF